MKSNQRAKSADPHRTREEKNELNALNHRFGSYLEKIKSLANINTNLRRQVDDAYRKYIGHGDGTSSFQHPLDKLRQQINDEVRAQSAIHIRLQRAEYDLKFYQVNLKLLTRNDQIHQIQKQFETTKEELEQLQRQYQRREEDLEKAKCQYNDSMKKYIDYSNQYDQITYQRLINENDIYTLKERISFEHELHQRRQEEFQSFNQIRFNINKDFNQNEFQQILQRIRGDFQQFNAIRLAELEELYKNKLDRIHREVQQRQQQQQQSTRPVEVRSAIETTKKEHRLLVEQNQCLNKKLECLEDDLHQTIDKNRQTYEKVNREYQQLEREIVEFDCILVDLRENAVNLWSEINTYRFLLVNLLSHEEKRAVVKKKIVEPAKSSLKEYRDEATGFVVHIEDGIVWVRI